MYFTLIANLSLGTKFYQKYLTDIRFPKTYSLKEILGSQNQAIPKIV